MFKVACIQLRSSHELKKNIKSTKRLIFKAIKKKADFILTPECSSIFSLNKKNF